MNLFARIAAIWEGYSRRSQMGGTTAMLLGTAVVVLGFMRRFARRRYFDGV
jgi:hypothetical protein